MVTPGAERSAPQLVVVAHPFELRAEGAADLFQFNDLLDEINCITSYDQDQDAE